jgi:hypothetical protein
MAPTALLTCRGLTHTHTYALACPLGRTHTRSCLPSWPQLLEVLRGALALGNPRLTEPALSCMHKLVAYAYLQGETGASGRLHDTDNVVTQVCPKGWCVCVCVCVVVCGVWGGGGCKA